MGGSVYVYERFCAVGYGDTHTRRNARTRQKKPQGDAGAKRLACMPGLVVGVYDKRDRLQGQGRSRTLSASIRLPAYRLRCAACRSCGWVLFRYKNGGRLLRPTPISKVKKLFSYLTYMKHGDMMQMGILPKYEKGA